MTLDRRSQLLQSSVPLCHIGEDHLPTSAASGCLIDYCARTVLLTVEHAVGRGKQWAIQVGYDLQKSATEMYGFGNTLRFLQTGNIVTGESETIDFAYAEVPRKIQVWRQDISEQGKIVDKWPITAFPIAFDVVPTSEDTFGFAGLVKGQLEMHPGTTFYASELKIYDGLKYLRTDKDMLVFELPMAHPGHPEFKGCSGAPILNGAGMPIALVCGGLIDKNEIYGVSLKRYQTPIDILVGKFG
jgi:hypothetical protein